MRGGIGSHEMKIENAGDTIRVLAVEELNTATATTFQESVQEAVTESIRHIEVDLSGMVLLDSCGLGTLVALRKMFGRRGGSVRLLNPAPQVLQMLELTRLHRILEVVRLPAAPG